MQLCPVCFWEDAPGETPYNSSNDVSLVEGQRNFIRFGACEEIHLNAVRSPVPTESRSSRWLSFDDLSEKVITSIEKSFHNVTRDGGTTLHQMDLIDGGWPIKEEAMKIEEKKDPETRWQDIPSGKLSESHESLAFLDDLGLRFYLPAFMRHALRTSQPGSIEPEIIGILGALSDGPENSFWRGAFAMLQREQKEAVAGFLQLIALKRDGFHHMLALKALNRGWQAYVPPFIKEAII
jgi:hypothetical protein